MSDSPKPVLALPTLSPEQHTQLSQTIDKIFDTGVSDQREALGLVQENLESIDPQNPNAKVVQVVLESAGRYFQALIKMTSETNFGEAWNLLQQAANGFGTTGFEELRDISTGIGFYAEAVDEAQHLNLARASELMTQVKGYLDQAGKFGAKFQPLIDQLEPDHLYLAALPHLARLDFDAAAPLIESAADTAERVAAKYHEKGDSQDCLFRGMAHYYRAYFRLIKSSSDFNQLNYAALTSQKDLGSKAILAQQFLLKTDPDSGTNDIQVLMPTLAEADQLAVKLRALPQVSRVLTLSSFIPHDERIVTIEDAAELQLQQDHVVRLETRPPNIEGKGAVNTRDLVRNALRMRPERIIIGE